MIKIWTRCIGFIFVLTSLVQFKAQAEVPFYDTVDTMNSLQLEVISKEFKDSAMSYLNKIKLLGIQSLQNKSIDSIIAGVQNIKILVFNEIKFNNNDQLSTSRNCAYWDKELKAIVVSYLNWVKITAIEKESIAAHEVFGLLGIDDNNFEITSLFDAYFTVQKIYDRSDQNNKFDSNAFELFKRILKNPIFLSGGGGVSGVGGGGDLRPLGYKTMLITTAFVSFNFKEVDTNSFFKLIGMYQLINIEFSSDVAHGSYLFDSKKLTLFIPNNALTKENSATNAQTIRNLNAKFINIIAAGQK